MPWRHPMSERMRFLARLQAGERMSELCAEYGISRKTGYKFKERFEQRGPAGLYDLPRRPKHSPARTPEAIRDLLLGIRREHPTWGPKKLLCMLRERNPEMTFPAPSTAGEILKHAGLVQARRWKQRVPSLDHTRTQALGPNDVWCADYKGEFRLGNGSYCYPLTITDDATRFIVGCEAFERIDSLWAIAVFEDRFARYGLPLVIRTDNGAPFASRGLFGLTRLSAYWVKLGIAPERIEPGRPQQNGRHERMHRTLKQEATRPAAANLLQQQENFDCFVATFNEKRPHEALGQKCPASLYSASPRPLASRPAKLDYPLHDQVRRVDASGHLRILRKRHKPIYLTKALAGERVGLRSLSRDCLLLSFASLDLGWVDVQTMTFHPADLDTR